MTVNVKIVEPVEAAVLDAARRVMAEGAPRLVIERMLGGKQR